MKLYEGVIILPPNTAPEDRKAQEQLVTETIEKAKGKIVDRKEIGTRSLAYEVKKHKEGFVVVLTFQLAPSAVKDLSRVLQLSSGVIKFMLTLKDERLEGYAEAARKRAEHAPAVASRDDY